MGRQTGQDMVPIHQDPSGQRYQFRLAQALLGAALGSRAMSLNSQAQFLDSGATDPQTPVLDSRRVGTLKLSWLGAAKRWISILSMKSKSQRIYQLVNICCRFAGIV